MKNSFSVHCAIIYICINVVFVNCALLFSDHSSKSLQGEQYAQKPNNQLPKQAFTVVLTELGTSHIHHYPLTNSCQGRIHTGFHRFTEIGQIFHNKHIFNNNNNNNNNNNRTFKDGLTNVFFFQFPGIKQKPGKGNFRDLKSQNLTGGACPRAPLEACSLGPSFRKSVSIYPRSAPGCVLFSLFLQGDITPMISAT